MKYFLIVGEASGDLHASNLMAAIAERDSEAEFCFLGGDLMAKVGGRMVRHYRDMAFMGVLNVVRHLPKILGNMRATQRAIAEFCPDVLILVDYPSFNLQIAKWAKRHLPKMPLFYYISPKLWAWKTYRIKAIKRYIDQMFTIFPFETEFYANFGYRVQYVGNPTVDAVENFRKNNVVSDSEFRQKQGLDGRPIVAILAGSRQQEIRTTLPRVVPIALQNTDYQFVIAAAPSADVQLYQPFLSDNVRLVQNDTYRLLSSAHAAVVNSGTATLETALLGVPQVVVYHVFGGRLASLLKKILIKTRFISLVNLVAEKAIVRELVAHEFTTELVAAELTKLLRDADCHTQMRAAYAELSRRLGGEGAAAVAAKGMIAELRRAKVCV